MPTLSLQNVCVEVCKDKAADRNISIPKKVPSCKMWNQRRSDIWRIHVHVWLVLLGVSAARCFAVSVILETVLQQTWNTT